MKTNKVVFYQDKAKEWRWRIVASNGKTRADSGEGYEKRATCMRNFKSLAEVFKANKYEVVKP